MALSCTIFEIFDFDKYCDVVLVAGVVCCRSEMKSCTAAVPRAETQCRLILTAMWTRASVAADVASAPNVIIRRQYE